ncbi:MAG: Asp-tRNA(Asn)/Glu-tRNA(Gln) amidotransferase subunit GatC [Candidatus Falkowbacteria bacterium]|nr:Asp-tRNA(Asn)/Glu-tRNA(Gln) amidotransferase subunit GatC [Candidatus Falkowbacteria bacterium]
MSLKVEEIKHIAQLSRLELSPAELKTYGAQLSSILDYIDKLKKVKTADVSILDQGTDLNNIWRADEVKDWDKDEIEVALKQGDLEDRLIRVKKVL